MKRKILILSLLLFLVSLPTLSFAKATKKAASPAVSNKVEVIKGSIVSIDSAKNELVVKDNKTGTDKTVAVDAKILASLKSGENVKVKFEPATGKAKSVKILAKSKK